MWMVALALFSGAFLSICLGVFHLWRLMGAKLPLKARIKASLMGPLALLASDLWVDERDRHASRWAKRYFGAGGTCLLLLYLLYLVSDSLLRR